MARAIASVNAGYSVRDVVQLLDVSPALVRRYARDGLLDAERSGAGHYRLTFRDVVLLRTASDLARRFTPRRVRSALLELKSQVPGDRSLAGLRISAQGDAIVARDGTTAWNPLSGQVILDFDVAELEASVTSLEGRVPLPDPQRVAAGRYAQACSLDGGDDPVSAFDAYRAVLDADPEHIGARINVGRLYHEARQLEAAEQQYRIAAALDPTNATAAFNLGVALEDQSRLEEALEAYRSAIEADEGFADAWYNAAAICEELGREREAVEHLARYRRLMIRSV